MLLRPWTCYQCSHQWIAKATDMCEECPDCHSSYIKPADLEENDDEE